MLILVELDAIQNSLRRKKVAVFPCKELIALSDKPKSEDAKRPCWATSKQKVEEQLQKQKEQEVERVGAKSIN